MIEYLSRLFADLKEESGQTMAEYAVVLGVITIAVVVTLGLLSSKISAVLSSVIPHARGDPGGPTPRVTASLSLSPTFQRGWRVQATR